MTTNQPKVTDKPVARFNPVLDTEDGGYGFVTMKQSEHGQWVPLSTFTAQAAALVAAEANAWPFGKRPNPVCGHTQGEFAVYGDEASIKKVRAAIHELDAMMSHRIERIKHEQSLRETAETEVATLKARIAELEVRFKSQIDYTLQWLRLTSHTRRRNNG